MNLSRFLSESTASFGLFTKYSKLRESKSNMTYEPNHVNYIPAECSEYNVYMNDGL